MGRLDELNLQRRHDARIQCSGLLNPSVLARRDKTDKVINTFVPLEQIFDSLGGNREKDLD
jgi:hypothetical protein